MGEVGVIDLDDQPGPLGNYGSGGDRHRDLRVADVSGARRDRGQRSAEASQQRAQVGRVKIRSELGHGFRGVAAGPYQSG